MTATDPVTGTGGLFVAKPSDEELHAAAVDAIAEVLGRRWDSSHEELTRAATDVINLALDVGPRKAAVLTADSHADCARLADAVLRTGTRPCPVCQAPKAVYSGIPDDGDLAAARKVINTLLGGRS